MMKLSIITINYNNVFGLKKTIESVISQTYHDYEYILIDGGSTDGSDLIMNEYADRITYSVSERDHGIYNAMNKGIEVAKGDYLLFLNSGDCLYERNIIESVVNKLDGFFDFVIGATITSDGVVLKIIDDLNSTFFLENSLSHQSTFIKRDLFKNRLYNEDFRIVSDWEFFYIQLILHRASYIILPEIISIFDASGISSQEVNKNMIYLEREISLSTNLSEMLHKDLIELNQKRKFMYKLIESRLLLISTNRISWFLFNLVTKLIVFITPKKTD